MDSCDSCGQSMIHDGKYMRYKQSSRSALCLLTFSKL